MTFKFSSELRAKSHASQRKKYGKGYSDEMRRRASLRKKHGTGANKDNYPDLSVEMARRAKVRWNAKKQTAVKGKDNSKG